jgi:hypothetical protein
LGALRVFSTHAGHLVMVTMGQRGGKTSRSSSPPMQCPWLCIKPWPLPLHSVLGVSS